MKTAAFLFNIGCNIEQWELSEKFSLLCEQSLCTISFSLFAFSYTLGCLTNAGRRVSEWLNCFATDSTQPSACILRPNSILLFLQSVLCKSLLWLPICSVVLTFLLFWPHGPDSRYSRSWISTRSNTQIPCPAFLPWCTVACVLHKGQPKPSWCLWHMPNTASPYHDMRQQLAELIVLY